MVSNQAKGGGANQLGIKDPGDIQPSRGVRGDLTGNQHGEDAGEPFEAEY